MTNGCTLNYFNVLTEIEKLLLELYQKREEKAREHYDKIFHPHREIIDSEEIIRPLYKKLIETPDEEVPRGYVKIDGKTKKPKLLMYSDDDKQVFSDKKMGLKDCSTKTGIPFQIIKSCVSNKKQHFYKEWNCYVKFMFIYE